MHFRKSVCTNSPLASKAYAASTVSCANERRVRADCLICLIGPEQEFQEQNKLIIPWCARKIPLAVLFLIALRLAAQEPCSIDFPHDANPTAITDEDVCNFHQVDSQMYRGGRPRASAYPKLEALGIRTIINLEEEESAQRERDALLRLNENLKPEDRIDFVSFPISQTQIDKTGISNDEVKELFQLIEKARKPVLIHCYYGRDRTGAVMALYRMLYSQMSYEDALEEAYHYKFSSEDSGLKRTLHHYRHRERLEALIPSASSLPKGP
jgi:protein tyrosine/serine phosphatase